MYQIKICGITTKGDALLAAEAGADAIGLNFYEKSPRHVTADQAAEIVEHLRATYSASHVQVFGVFVNSTLDDILWTIREANLYGPEQGFGIQLHGDEPPELIQQLHQHALGQTGHLLQATGHVPTVPVVLAFRCHTGDLSSPAAYLKKCAALAALPQAALVDAFEPGTYGGTGKCLDWPSLARRKSALLDLPVILAGGLTPQNVAQAIATAHPDAIDAASGIESSPGKKDPAQVLAFVAAAKNAFATLARSASEG